MIKRIIDALSKLNNKLRQHAALRAAVTVLACVVVFVVTYVMIIPAVTLEYSANQDELAIETDNQALLGDGSTVTYSSNLGDFVTGMEVLNADGSSLGTANTVSLDTDYTLTITFAETTLKQMTVNSEGKMTYQLPDSIDAAPTESGLIYIGLNTVFGTYSIDSDGLITIAPNRCDVNGNTTDDYFINNYQNTEISISFAAQVSNNDGPGAVSIDLGNNVSVDLTVKSDGKLKTTKQFVSADYSTGMLNYRFTVTADGSDVSNVVIRDKANESQRFDASNVRVYDSDGNLVTFTEVTPTTTSTIPDGYTAPEGFSPDSCNNLPTGDKQYAFFVYGSDSTRASTEMYAHFDEIEDGETYTFEYSLPMSDYALASSESLYEKNDLTATGTNADGDTTTSTSTAGKTIDYNFITKTGVDMADTDSDDHRIKWTVTVDYKGASISSKMFMDMALTTENGSISLTGSSFDTDTPIAVTYWTADGTQGTTTIQWSSLMTMTDSGMTAYVFMPPLGGVNATKYILEYYSDYDPDAEDLKVQNVFGDYTGGNAGSMGGATVGIDEENQVVPTVTKNGYITSDAEHVHYDITIDMPEGMSNYSYYYLYDWLTFPSSSYSNYSNNFGKVDWDNLSITAVGDSGTVYTFTPYTGGDTSTGYYLYRVAANDVHYICFNSTNKSTSKWAITEHCTLTLSYDIPLDCALVKGSTDITDYTGGYLLENGVVEKNVFWVGYSGPDAGAEAYVGLSTSKTGTIDADGTADYTVEFKPGSTGIPVTDDNKISATGFKFIDEYDDELGYVAGSLKIKVQDLNDSDSYATYVYTGSTSAFDTNHKIEASASDFTLDAANTTNGMTASTLAALLNGQIDRDDYKLVATYQLAVTDEAKGEVATTLTLDNTGYFQWTGGTTNKPTQTLTYDTKLMSKEFVQNGDKLTYTILLNPGKLDLLEDNDRIRIVDKMSDNLSVYWETINVYYYDDDTDSWVDMDSADSDFTYTKSFDSDENAMTFDVPDSQYLKFTYITLITETGKVSVNNTVSLVGYGDVVKASEAQFAVAKSGGTASAGDIGFTIQKQSTSGEMLSDAAFAIYIDNPSPSDADDNPYGALSTLTITDAYGSTVTLTYYKTYTTGEDGTIRAESQYYLDDHTYAVKEVKAPTGYQTIDDPILFNLNPNAVDRDIEMLQVSTMLSIQDSPLGYELPSTGGIGIYVFYIAGALLIMTGFAIVIKKKKLKPGVKHIT